MSRIVFLLLALTALGCSKSDKESEPLIPVNMPAYFPDNIKLGMSYDDVKIYLAGSEMSENASKNAIMVKSKHLIVHYNFTKGVLVKLIYSRTYIIERESETESLRNNVEGNTRRMMNNRFPNEDDKNSWSDERIKCNVDYSQDSDRIIMMVCVEALV